MKTQFAKAVRHTIGVDLGDKKSHVCVLDAESEVASECTITTSPAAFGPDTDLRRWGLKLAERGGKSAKKRAVGAVARKLAVLLRRLWVTGAVYEPLRNTEKKMLAA